MRYSEKFITFVTVFMLVSVALSAADYQRLTYNNPGLEVDLGRWALGLASSG